MAERRRSLRILGIDPGLDTTGYAALDLAGDSPAIVEAGAIRSDARAEMPRRIAQIHADLAEVLSELSPDVVAIEKLYAHYKHPRTSILMGHARGAILLACEQAGIAVRSVPATAVKRSLTGNGHASKQQVQRSVQSMFRLDAPPEPPDVADAMAIALCVGRRAVLR